MKIDSKHHTAAKLLATGHSERETAKEVGVTPFSVVRWKRDEEFRALMLQYSPPLRAAIENSSETTPDLYDLIPDREAPLFRNLEWILKRLGKALNNRLERLEDEIDDIPIRSLPTLLKAYIDGLETLQKAHDRASGYELISKELIDIVSVKDNAQN